MQCDDNNLCTFSDLPLPLRPLCAGQKVKGRDEKQLRNRQSKLWDYIKREDIEIKYESFHVALGGSVG